MISRICGVALLSEGPGERRLLGIIMTAKFRSAALSLVLSASVSPAALAQVVAPNATAEGVDVEANARDTVDELIVTGTRRADVTALQSGSPVDVVSADRIAATGAPNIAEALSQIAPSINFLRYTGIGATAGVSSPQLRGLGGDQVLVLINGKRRHASSQIHAKVGYGRGEQAVDWNTIPGAAVQRIEVLRDGASAQYGSDAISGVVNVVLREAAEGGSVSVQAGQNYHGGGETVVVDAWKGFSLPNGGFATLSGSYNKIGDTGPAAYPDTRQQYYAGDPNAARDNFANRYNRQVTPNFEEYNFVLNARLPLTGELSAYAFASAGRRVTDKTGVRRRPLDNQTVRAIFPDGYTPYQEATSTDYAVTGGVTYDNAAVGRLDLSATYGRNKIGYDIHDTLNPSLGAASPTSFYNGAQANEQTHVDLDYVRDFNVFGASPLTVSGGLTYRHEVYTIEAGEPLSYTQGGVRVLNGPNAGQIAQGETVGYAPFRPLDAGAFKRNVWGVNVGLEQAFGNLLVGVAARYEDYSDFGDTATGKLSLRYDFTPTIAVRATANTGFRAPSIGQLGWSATTVTWSTTQPGVFFDTRTVPVSHPYARALGAADLKPEKSTNYSAGLVWRPAPSASVTVDAYRIDVDDRITLTGNLTGIDSLTAPLGLARGSALSFFTNALDTRTKGIDVVANYSLDVLDGQLDLSAAFNANRTRIQALKAAPAPLAALGKSLVDREARGLIEHLAPKSKLALTANYVRGPWQVNIAATRYGDYRRNHATNPALDVDFGPQVVVDASLGYDFTERFRLTAGARNLFDSFPDIDTITLSNALVSGGDKYSAFAPRGSTGGYYYLTASYRF